MDSKKVIHGLRECLELLDCVGTGDKCKKYVSDAIELLEDQKLEIEFLKAMLLQTVHNMKEEDIGNAVAKVLGLKGR